jgi:hypothetical protein
VGQLFGSLDSCTRSRLLWHMFTFASSTRKGMPSYQLLRTRSKKDEPERTALQIARTFALHLRLALQRCDFRRVTAARCHGVHHAFPRQRCATLRKGAPHPLPAQAPMKQLYHTGVGAPYALSTGS